MYTTNLSYQHGDQEFLGFLAYDNQNKKPRPAVLVAHDWTGRNDFACKKASLLAEMGYVGFAIDMYGNGVLGQNNDEKMALIKPLMDNRDLLAERIQSAFDTVAALPEVDSSKIAAIGFCFGGLCVLDLARNSAHHKDSKLQGVVSFHGLLGKPGHKATSSIQAKILALHGYDDPMVSPADVQAFCQEMTEAGADWQFHAYGKTMHAFTNPEAHDPGFGTVYSELAEKRSMQAMKDFLREVF